jgi:hypothetical protein
MRLPAGKGLRIDLIGGEDEVLVVVSGVVRAGGIERARELSRAPAADLLAAFRVARDWLTARLVAEAEAHAPPVPPTPEEIEAAAADASSHDEQTPF